MSDKIKAPTGNLIPVELYSGILDGHRTAVREQPEILDRYLFELRWGGLLYRVAYKPAHRTNSQGKRWVLTFDCIVSTQRITEA